MKGSTFYCFLTLLCSLSNAFNILVIFNHPGKSHFEIYSTLFKALLAREHNVTIVSYYPLETRLPNYREVRLGDSFEKLKNPEVLSLRNFMQKSKYQWVKGVKILENYTASCEKFYKSKNLRYFLKEENEYDLILMQYFLSDCVIGLTKKFNAPYIGK